MFAIHLKKIPAILSRYPNVVYIENYPCCAFLCKRHAMKGAFAQKGAAGIIFDMSINM
jgi:hypothetical protein